MAGSPTKIFQRQADAAHEGLEARGGRLVFSTAQAEAAASWSIARMSTMREVLIV